MTGEQENHKHDKVSIVADLLTKELTGTEGDLFKSLTSVHQRYLIDFCTHGACSDDAADQIREAFKRAERDRDKEYFQRWLFMKNNISKVVRVRDLSLLLTYPLPVDNYARKIICASLDYLLCESIASQSLEVKCYPWNDLDGKEHIKDRPVFSVPHDRHDYYANLPAEVKAYASIHIDDFKGIVDSYSFKSGGKFNKDDLVNVWDSYITLDSKEVTDGLPIPWLLIPPKGTRRLPGQMIVAAYRLYRERNNKNPETPGETFSLITPKDLPEFVKWRNSQVMPSSVSITLVDGTEWNYKKHLDSSSRIINI